MIIRLLQISVILIAIIAINSVLATIKADTYKKEGKELLKKNFPYLAVDKFSKALKLDSSDGETRGYLGISYISLAEKTNKEELLKKAIYEMEDARKTYEDSSINYHLAKTYELSGDVDNAIQEAIKSYNQIPSGETKDKLINLYKIKGDMLLSQNKKDEAIKFYTKFVELKEVNVKKEDIADYEFLRNLMPDNFFVRYGLASLYREQKLLDKVVIELEYIRKIGISNESIRATLLYAYYNLGTKNYNEKKYKEAESYFNNIITIAGIDSSGYGVGAINSLSKIYEQLGDIDKAVETLMKLEDIDTQKGQGYYQIAQLFVRKSNSKKAIEYFEKYLPFRPISDVDVFIKLGSLYEQEQNIDKAVEALMKLEEIDTQKGQGYYQIGQLYNRKTNPHKAIEYFEKYIPFRPISDVDVFIKLGSLYEQVGNIGTATKFYRKLEEVNSYKGQGHYYIGLLYERKERWANALKEFEYVLEIKPKDSHLLLKIGRLYEKIGDNKKALEMYKNVIALDPTKTTELNIPMGRLYENIGEREMAIGLFKSGRIL